MAKELFRLHKSSGLIVSSEGRVLKRKRGSGFAFTFGSKNHKGYMEIHSRGKYYKVHRLIAEAFLPNPEMKPTVDHIDRNRSNNSVLNLRWATSHEQNLNSASFKEKAMWNRRSSRSQGKDKARICVILPDGRKSVLNVPFDIADAIYDLSGKERYNKIMEYRNENSV